MVNKVGFKLAASALAVGGTVIGCTPSANMSRPLALSAKAPKAESDAALYYDRAQAALQRRALDEALTLVEKAVELSPRDVAYRMMLADLYLHSGRFESAETSFADVLALNPGNSRAEMNLVLTRIAQGKIESARTELDRIGSGADVANVGLAYALAGDPLSAIELLEPAARSVDADGRIRQNLALAYALSGDWQKARVTAAQDVSPAELDNRMAHWAAFAQPASTYDQVATLLGVTPAADPGQPTRLALAPTVSETRMAVAGVPAPVELAAADDMVTIDLPPAAPIAAAEPAAPPSPAPVISAPALSFAEVVQSLTEPTPAMVHKAALVADAPLSAFAPAEKRSSKKVASGRFVVQIGAFSSPRLVEKAWEQAQKRYNFAEDSVPLSTTVTVGHDVTLHRLSIAGFDDHADADQFCRSIKAKHGVCFVRATAGDAPVQWASNAAARKA